MIPRVRELLVHNYKSLALVRVDLEPFTVLVGPNGSGKSNFIDALAFVQEALSQSIEMAFKNRGGISAVRRRSGGHPTHIGIRVVLDLGGDVEADYSFEIAAKPEQRFRVARERCIVQGFMDPKNLYSFEIRDGVFAKEIPGVRARVPSDRLALFAGSATEEFRPVYDFLSSMRFYSIAPPRLRELQEPDSGEFLSRDGSNAAAVLKRLEEEEPNDDYKRICRLLARAVDGIREVQYRSVGQKDTLQFKQDVGLKNPWTFDALNMSDGTLRLLGLLLAVFQPGHPRVVAVEEPEATVHPAVAELVVQVLLDASKKRQVLVTTHSPDLLDYKELSDTQVRTVVMERGSTIITPLAPSSRAAVQKRLYTPGELMRTGELQPDRTTSESDPGQLDIFGPPRMKLEGKK